MGKRHLQLALERWPAGPVAVRYRSFLLNPYLPEPGADFQQVMSAKGGGRVPLEYFFDAPRRKGAEVGLVFNFEKIRAAPNTRRAHQLIYLAPESKRPDLIEDLYAAYFEHGQDIGRLEVLTGIAAANGMEIQWVEGQLRSGDCLAEVEADLRWAREHGINAVPFFIVNGRYGISGAQPVEVILNLFTKIVNGEAGR